MRRLVDVTTKQEVLSLEDVSQFACSYDGQMLATAQIIAGMPHIKLWNLEQYSCIETGRIHDNIRAMAFRQRTGQLIIILENQGMHLWTPSLKRKLFSPKVSAWSKQRHPIAGQGNVIFNAWLSPDGETLVLKSEEYSDGLVVRHVNDLSTRISIASSSQRISFNEDSNYLIITEPTLIRFWHIPSQKEVKTIKSEGRTTAYLQGDIVVARGGDGNHELQLFDMATSKEFLRFPQQEATLSPDAHWLISQREYGSAYLFDITERTHHKMASNLRNPAKFLAFSANDEVLISINDDGEFAVWNVANGECVFETHMDLPTVRHMLVSNNNDCMMLASAGEDTYLIAYNWETGEQVYQQVSQESTQASLQSADITAQTRQVSDAISQLLPDDFAPSQEAQPQEDMHALLPYQADSLVAPILQNMAPNITEMHFSLNKDLWAYSDVNAAKVFVTTIEGEIVLEVPFFKEVYDVALSPHNKWLALSRASENPERKFVEIWDIAKREKLISCFTADSPYTQLFFSEDETKLLMNSEIDGVFFIALPSFAQVENWRNVYLEEKSHTMALHYKGLFVGENEKTSWMLVQEESMKTMLLGHIFTTWGHKVLTLDAQARYFLSFKGAKIAIWDLGAEDGIEHIGEINHSAEITSTALSANKRVVAIGDARGGSYSWYWQPADLITKACEYVTLERFMPGWRFRDDHFENEEYEFVSERYYSLQPFPAEVVLGELLLEQANYKIYAPREENLVRPYVYVVSDNCLAKYWLEPAVALAFNRGLHPKELGELKGILKRL